MGVTSAEGLAAPLVGVGPAPAVSETRVEQIRSIERFAELRAEWDALLSASAADCPFLTWEWLHTWWTHLADDRRLRLIAVRRSGELIAVAPLAVSPRHVARLVPFRRLEFLGTGSVGSDYLDVIARRGAEAEAAEALADHFTAADVVLELGQVKRHACLADDLAARLVERGWRAVERATDVCPYITLADRAWPEYLARLDGHHRSNFKRRLNNLGRNFSVTFDWARNEPERAEALRALVELHGMRWRERGGSTALYSPALLAFHDQWTRRALERGWLRLFVMRLDGRPVAALYGLRYRDAFYFYQTGFDPEFARHGVGQVTVGLTIQHAIEDKAREYDLLHGAERYKFDWAPEVREIGSIELYPPSMRGDVHRWTAELGRRVRKLARDVLPRGAAPAANGG
jgi:CelD/BcsL family acetyltransferase involved in cellulose biosynthesis